MSLYPERIRAIRWFEQNHPEDFDLYGIGWDPKQFPSYRGRIQSKHEILQKYRFSICYENTRDVPGYITEKIFDCLFAGCVPVYWGANNVTDHIPKGCFIDKREFPTYESLYEFLKNMPDDVYANYLNNIESFLNSDAAYPFSTQSFIETIVKECLAEISLNGEKQERKQHDELLTKGFPSQSKSTTLPPSRQEKVFHSAIVPGKQRGLSSIILTAYNKLDLTRQCVESILRYTTSPFELILIDNGSTDGTWEYFESVKNLHADTRVIKCFQNRVVEVNGNHAISIARGKYIIGVTNDIIVHENWLENFVDQLESAADIGMVGPRSNNISGPQLMPASYRGLEEYQEFAKKLSRENKGSSFNVARMVGMCIITKKSILERIGGFDIDLPTNGRDGGYGFSDDDISVRLMLAGYRLVVANDVFIHHFGSATISSDRFSTDLFGKALNINEEKFKKKLQNNPRIKMYANGQISLKPLTISDSIPVPNSLAIRFPSIALVQIVEKEGAKSAFKLKDFKTRITSVITIPREKFHKKIFKWAQSAGERNGFDYIAVISEPYHVSPADIDIDNLIETAFCFPDCACIVPVNKTGTATQRTVPVQLGLQVGQKGDAAPGPQENSSAKEKQILYADLSVSVLNLKLIQPCVKGLQHFTETEDALWFLQRRIRGEGYGILKTGQITVSSDRPFTSHPFDERILPEKLLAQGKVDEAKSIYLRDIEIDPTFVESMYRLASIEKDALNNERAKSYLKKILSMDENHIHALVLLSKIYMAEDDRANAEQYVKAAYFKQPRNPEVQKLAEEYTAFLKGPEAVIQPQIQEVRNAEQTLESPPAQELPASTKSQVIASIILTVSNRSNVTKLCLERIRKYTLEPHEVIFVSLDSSYVPRKWLRRMIKENKNFRWIMNPDSQSQGYSEIINAGIKEASGEYIVILDDSILVTDQWLTGLLDVLNKSDDTGIVGPMIMGGDGPQGVVTLQDSRGQGVKESSEVETQERFRPSRNDSPSNPRTLESLNPASLDSSNPTVLNEYAQVFKERNRYRRVPVKSLTGPCLAFKKALFIKIGPFDKRFVTARYALEDYCLRAAIERYRSAIAGDTVVLMQKPAQDDDHKRKAFSDRKSYLHKWSTIETINLHGHKLVAANVLSAVADLSEKGENEKALSAIREGLQSNLGDERLLFALVELLQDVKKFEDAYSVLQSMPDSAKQVLQWLYLAGSCKAGLQQYDEASRYAQQMLERDPSSAKGFNLSGLVAYCKKDFSGAERLFRQAIDADPGYGEAYANLGAAKWAMNDRESAFEYLEKAFILSPGTESIAVSYHSAAVSLARIEQAAIAFREASSLHPLNKRLKYMLADLLLQLQQYSEAMEVIEEALLRFGADDDTLTLAGALREKIGPHDRLRQDSRVQGFEDSSESSQKDNSATRTLVPLNPGTLSVCIIVKDEEKNIGTCLHKIRGLADEMIVVDTGSTDRTKEIAKVFGAKVFDFAWTNSFSDARNFSLSQATGDWLFVLDADETVAPEDFEKIRALITRDSVVTHRDSTQMNSSVKVSTRLNKSQSISSSHVAYSFVTRNYLIPITAPGWVANEGTYLEQEAGTGWFPSQKVRLFPNDRRIRFESPVHEFVEGSLSAAKIAIQNCPVPIHHYGKLDREKISAKGRHYYELGKAKLLERGEQDPLAIYELAVQASELEQFEESIAWWEKLVVAMPDFWKGHYGLGNAYYRTGQFQEAVSAVEKAVEKAPGAAEWRDAVLLFAWIATPVGRVQDSIRLMNQLLENNPDDTLASILVATAYLYTANKPKGFELLRQVKERKIDPSEFISEYARHLANFGKASEALVLLEAAVDAGIATGEMMALKEECERKIGENRDSSETHRDSIESEQKETNRDSSRLVETEKQEYQSPNLNQSQSVSVSQSQSVSLSLCMIVKDEEQNIRRALESAKPVVDEMIVVDTGSSDRTKEIAEELGAKVCDFPWTDSFAEARNFSLSKATGDWILILDADEVISVSDHDELRRLIKRDPIETHGDVSAQSPNLNESQLVSPLSVSSFKTAYLFTTRNYVMPMNVSGWVGNDGSYREEEAGTGWFPGEKVRLFPNDGRLRFEDPVHERIEPSLERIGISVERCGIAVHHYGKLDEEKRRAKNEYYYELGKKRLAEKGASDHRALYDLGVQAAGIGRYREAIRYLSQVVSLDPSFVDAHASMGNVYYNLGQYENALSSYRKAIERDPNHEHAAVMAAQCEIIAGKAENAVHSLEPLVRKDHASGKALYPLVAAYVILGQDQKAVDCIQELNDKQSDLTGYLSGYAKLLASRNSIREAELLIKTAEKIKNG